MNSMWEEFEKNIASAIEKASTETDTKLASHVSSMTRLTDHDVREMFPKTADLIALNRLIGIVKSRDDQETKIRRLREIGRPSIVVTHDVRDVTALDAEVCVLEGGRITQRGRIDDLRADPASDFVAEFVGPV